MSNIDSLLLELETLPRGYISKKIIDKKAYFYLQYRDGNKGLLSKYLDIIEYEKASDNSYITYQKELKAYNEAKAKGNAFILKTIY